MASRAIWSGQLRLSLVAIPVEVHPATRSSSKISFRQIHGPTGKPVRYEKVVEGVGRIDTDEIMKGYETDDGEYVLIPPDEVDAIRLETKKTLELVQFVDMKDIPPLYFDQPYYVIPKDKLSMDAYRVVRDALRRTGRVGLGQLTMRGKEYLCAVKPCGDGLLLETLRYEEEVRDAEPMFAQITEEEVDPDLLDVAETLIDRKTGPFRPEAFTDRYGDALKDLVERKVSNARTPRASVGDGDRQRAVKPDNVIDLMEALKRSLGEGGGDAAKRSRAEPAAKGKPRGRPAKQMPAEDRPPAPSRDRKRKTG
jgi:DNA end-binding protein Ku